MDKHWLSIIDAFSDFNLVRKRASPGCGWWLVTDVATLPVTLMSVAEWINPRPSYNFDRGLRDAGVATAAAVNQPAKSPFRRLLRTKESTFGLLVLQTLPQIKSGQRHGELCEDCGCSLNAEVFELLYEYGEELSTLAAYRQHNSNAMSLTAPGRRSDRNAGIEIPTSHEIMLIARSPTHHTSGVPLN